MDFVVEYMFFNVVRQYLDLISNMLPPPLSDTDIDCADILVMMTSMLEFVRLMPIAPPRDATFYQLYCG